jgi:hypothetical protein
LIGLAAGRNAKKAVERAIREERREQENHAYRSRSHVFRAQKSVSQGKGDEGKTDDDTEELIDASKVAGHC